MEIDVEKFPLFKINKLVNTACNTVTNILFYLEERITERHASVEKCKAKM